MSTYTEGMGGAGPSIRKNGETVSTDHVLSVLNNHAELVKALERQCDNMSFVVNNADLHGFYDKFKDELEEDRAALKSAGALT